MFSSRAAFVRSIMQHLSLTMIRISFSLRLSATRKVGVPLFKAWRTVGSNFLCLGTPRQRERDLPRAAHNREGHRCSQCASERARKKELPRVPKRAPKNFQYFSRAAPENSALRASCGKFIGTRRNDFRRGRV